MRPLSPACADAQPASPPASPARAPAALGRRLRAASRAARLCATTLLLHAGACATAQPRAGNAPATREASAPDATPREFNERERLRFAQHQAQVRAAAAEYGVEPDLLNAVIWVESRFDSGAVSSAGARGLMQLMPATAAGLAKEMGVAHARPHDPEFNVRAGAYYLSRLRARFDGDEALALAAYNAGAGNVRKWMAASGELPEHSRRYVERVAAARAMFRDPAVAATRDPAPSGPSEDHTLLAMPPATRAPAPVVVADDAIDGPVFAWHPEYDNARATDGIAVVGALDANGTAQGDEASDLPTPPLGPTVGPGILVDLADLDD